MLLMFSIELDIVKPSSICNSILSKLSLKNRDILLNSFKTMAFCCIVCKLGANTHFPQNIRIESFGPKT